MSYILTTNATNCSKILPPAGPGALKRAHGPPADFSRALRALAGDASRRKRGFLFAPPPVLEFAPPSFRFLATRLIPNIPLSSLEL